MGFGGFSWKRALGITKVKQKVSRSIGIPLTKSGRQRKLGALIYPKKGSLISTLPILGLVFHAFSSRKRDAEANYDEKICPFCAETIKAAALVCKHCGRELSNADSESDQALSPIPSLSVDDQSSSFTPPEAEKKKAGCLKIGLYILAGLFALAFIRAAFNSVDSEQTRKQDGQMAQEKQSEKSKMSEKD